MSAYPPHTAAARGLAACSVCGKVQEETDLHCARCHTTLHKRTPRSLQRTLALTFASMVLYIPANLLPIMTVEGLGGEEPSTILGGVITFWQMHAYPVAIIIFTASVVIPILKLAAILRLCWAAVRPCNPRSTMRIYRLTEIVGRWSMVDVFVVAILVAVVQFGSLMAIRPGPAAVAFGGVVILTMLAAMSFDPRLIWDHDHKRRQLSPHPAHAKRKS